MRRRNKGGVLLLGGLLCLTAALCFCLWNLREQMRAERAAQEARIQLSEQLSPRMKVQEEVSDPDRSMPVVEVDGQQYIGLLEIPALDRTLPVQSEWSDTALETAPCRYQGSLYREDLIIAGHNYRSHFGTLSRLEPGDFIYFTDGEGIRYTFEVDALETLLGTDFAGMESGDWDLTLFTCTWGGQNRLAVRCVVKMDTA